MVEEAADDLGEGVKARDRMASRCDAALRLCSTRRVLRIISPRCANQKEQMPIARRTWADVDSLKGETAGDKSCKDAAEALISETGYQMFLLCSNADGWADNDGRFGEQSQGCPS